MESMPAELPQSASNSPRPGWFSVWMTIVINPKEKTLIEISESSHANQNTALKWIFFSGVLPFVIAGVMQTILAATGLDGSIIENSDDMNSEISVLFVLVVYSCLAPFLGTITVGFFVVGVGCVHGLAKLAGGTGSFEKLVYVLGAITAPFIFITLVTIYLLMILIFENQTLALLIGVIESATTIHFLILQALTTKALNRFGWLAGMGLSLFSGLAIFSILGCCLIVGILGTA